MLDQIEAVLRKLLGKQLDMNERSFCFFLFFSLSIKQKRRLHNLENAILKSPTLQNLALIANIVRSQVWVNRKNNRVMKKNYA